MAPKDFPRQDSSTRHLDDVQDTVAGAGVVDYIDGDGPVARPLERSLHLAKSWLTRWPMRTRNLNYCHYPSGDVEEVAVGESEVRFHCFLVDFHPHAPHLD